MHLDVVSLDDVQAETNQLKYSKRPITLPLAIFVGITHEVDNQSP